MSELSIKSEQFHQDIDNLKKYIKMLISTENKLYAQCEKIKNELDQILMQSNENRTNFKKIKNNLLP